MNLTPVCFQAGLKRTLPTGQLLTWSGNGGCSWLTSRGLIRGTLSVAAPSWSPESLPGFPEKLQPSFTMVDSGPCPAPETDRVIVQRPPCGQPCWLVLE